MTNLTEDFQDGDVELNEAGEDLCECCGKKYTVRPEYFDGYCAVCRFQAPNAVDNVIMVGLAPFDGDEKFPEVIRLDNRLFHLSDTESNNFDGDETETGWYIAKWESK